MKQFAFILMAAAVFSFSGLAVQAGEGCASGCTYDKADKMLVKEGECTYKKDKSEMVAKEGCTYKKDAEVMVKSDCADKGACSDKVAAKSDCGSCTYKKDASEMLVKEEKASEGAAAAASPLEAAPQFSLEDHNGKVHSLADFKGKIVVLEWFNEECPFVVDHYQAGKKTTMNDMAAKYGEKGVVWLAINSSNFTTNENNKSVVKKWDMKHPILNDASGKVGKAYGAKRTPQMIVISPEQNIIYNGAIDSNPLGRKDSTVNHLANALDKFLAGETNTLITNKAYGCSVKYEGKSKKAK